VCLETRVSVLLDASSDEVWSVVRSLNLGQLLPGMFLSSCVKNGPAHRVGSLRVATCKAPASDIGDGSCAGDGAWTYKVMELSDTQRLVGWELVSVESASSTFAPYSSCYQLLRVIPVTTAPTPQCFVSWTAAFSSDAHASDVAAFRTHQQRGLASLRETVLIAGNIAKLDTKGVVPASCRHVMMDDAFPLEECVSAFRAAGGTLVSVDPEALVAKFTLSPTDIVCVLRLLAGCGVIRGRCVVNVINIVGCGACFSAQVPGVQLGSEPVTSAARAAVVSCPRHKLHRSSVACACSHRRCRPVRNAARLGGAVHRHGRPLPWSCRSQLF